MLELRRITKDYISDAAQVHALRGIDIAFRESEFVSILGPSGCGKTTLLNIIGGLDRYTSGDLIINGRSTKEFKDRDWDSYRNHSIGFVFQSYNLIPHQTVLSNVELALTLSGVSKAERRRRATEVLQKVGLGDQLKKRPNQMSGGQMQRVAIARALVNNPDILLADEPTGALDSETSVQIMELLKDISRDKLIIMVTHNPDLAEQYSSRIVRLLDGEITGDSMPYTPTAEETAVVPDRGPKKPSMSFFTAMALSLNNLMTKKGRTFLTAFAGSIGIIGIALILSLSSGVQTYITNMEEDTLSSYPITIESSTVDMTSMMTSMMTSNQKDNSQQEPGYLYSNNVMTGMINSMMSEITTNDLQHFKSYLEEDGNEISALCSTIEYTYDTQIGIYRGDTADGIVQVNPCNIMKDLGFSTASPMGDVGGMSSMYGSTDVCQQLVGDETMWKSTYSLVDGSWPQNYNELLLIVDSDDQISDYTLYALGLLSMDELTDAMAKAEQNLAENGSTGEVVDTASRRYAYADLRNLDLKLVLPTDVYQRASDGTWTDMSSDTPYMKNLLSGSESLKIVGIARTSDDSRTTGVLGYTQDLTRRVVDGVDASDIVKQQLENPDVDVLTGLPFKGTPAADEIEAQQEAAGNSAAPSYNDAQQALIASVVAALPEEYQSAFSSIPAEQQGAMLVQYGLLQQADLDALGGGGSKPAISSSSYEENLALLGQAELDSPSAINLYASSFADKDALASLLDAYNTEQTDGGHDAYVVKYTDYVGMLMSSITRIINAISYVLIAFVSISLIVSSIMIGIITYISVLERTKEIGILRSIGASKRDVSRVFNAETLLIGLTAGLIGILVTVLLDIPINLIINQLAGISGMAKLPVVGGVILVLISVLLTVVAGLIPSKMAAKKDPVVALRTE